jgi:hypothetical protein
MLNNPTTTENLNTRLILVKVLFKLEKFSTPELAPSTFLRSGFFFT